MQRCRARLQLWMHGQAGLRLTAPSGFHEQLQKEPPALMEKLSKKQNFRSDEAAELK